MLRYPRRLLLLAFIAVAALVPLARASVRAQATEQYPTDQWYAQFWENTTLSGPAFSTGFAPKIDNRWGLGRPLDGQDTFSARWTRSASFPAGVYRFVATMDDGMRVWVDDTLIIDAWGMSAEHTVSRDCLLYTSRCV